MESVNEQSTGYLTAGFKNEAGVLQAPNTVRYRIDDVDSGQAVRDWTSIAPGASVVITLTKDDNAILDTTREWETRRVTTEGVYGPADQVTGEYEYRVTNLHKYP
jgi:hypothetical protein